MNLTTSAASERNMMETWTVRRATFFIAGGSAVIWGYLVYAVASLF
ncbi:MAG: hypothetical protein WD767_11195 [Alphaproteobacteria bacterium]